VTTFEAFRIFDDNGAIQGRLVRQSIDELSAGDVTIKAAYSSVNYKDALAATGAGKILRRFPLNGGIDVAGAVAASTDIRFREGDEVIVTGYDLGVGQDGGFAGYVRVPAGWVVQLPHGLTLFDAMTLGTAGFTAGLSIVRLEHNGLAPGAGPVIVTGATGGVGSIAVAALSARGYSVTAMTGKESEHDYLRSLGASAVLPRSAAQETGRPLDKATWAGAVDPAGGGILAWLTRTMQPGAGIACSGLTAGVDVRTTVLPFILRGVNLLGIDSVACPMPLRLEVWRRLAGDLKPAALTGIATEIGLAELPGAFQRLLKGEARGRFVVRAGAA